MQIEGQQKYLRYQYSLILVWQKFQLNSVLQIYANYQAGLNV